MSKAYSIYSIGDNIQFYYYGDSVTGKVLRIHQTIFGRLEYYVECFFPSLNNYSNMHGGFRAYNKKHLWVKTKNILTAPKDKDE